MHLTSTAIVWIILLMSIYSCKSIKKESTEKFIPFVSLSDIFISGRPLLITKLDRPTWKVVYGFQGNNNCDAENKFTAEHDTQLQQSIAEVLRLWVEPLNIRLPALNFVKKDTVTRQNYVLFKFAEHDKPDLAILLFCRQGDRAWDFLPKRWSSVKYDKYTVNFLYYADKSPRRGITDLNRYSMDDLVHGIGHSFGLADTFRRSFPKAKSTGVDAKTVGKQPLSVMNAFVNVDLEHKKILLGEDDKQGIKWLYRYYVKKDIDDGDCPADFFYEKISGGCAPKYPVIFVVKQGSVKILQRLLDASKRNLLEWLLRHDKKLNLNAQDSTGNTPLHYAAMLEAHDGNAAICKLLVGHDDVDLSIKNNAGQTAADLVGANSECFNQKK